MNKKKYIFLLIFLISLLFFLNYNFLNSSLEKFLLTETEIVNRIVDGDTIVLENKERVRLLGIDAPERGEKYFKESSKFLEDLILNESVNLEFTKRKYDKYGRLLAYIHLRGKNINLEMVKNGFANYYSYDGKDHYHDQFIKAWDKCLEQGKYLCETSKNPCARCIEIKEIDSGKGLIAFYNRCSFLCDLSNWELRNEGRKNYFFPNFSLQPKQEFKIIFGEGLDSNSELYWEGENFVWARTGDTLFLRDKENKLVLWKFINY